MKKIILILVVLIGGGVLVYFFASESLTSGVIAECEMKVGKTLFDDYYMSNKDICYGDKAMEGNYSACLQLHNPAECLLGVSQNRKELVCDKVSNSSVRDKCVDSLVRYYTLETFLSYEGIERIIKRETISLQEGENLPYIGYEVKIVDGMLQQPTRKSVGGKIIQTGYEEFDCEPEGTRTSYKKITGGEPEKELGLPYIFIDNCRKDEGQVVVDFIKFE